MTRENQKILLASIINVKIEIIDVVYRLNTLVNLCDDFELNFDQVKTLA